jgi:flagellin
MLPGLTNDFLKYVFFLSVMHLILRELTLMAVKVFDSTQVKFFVSQNPFGNVSVRETGAPFQAAKLYENSNFKVSQKLVPSDQLQLTEQARYKVKKMLNAVATAQDVMLQMKIADTGLRSARKVLVEMKNVIAEAMNPDTADGDRQTLNSKLADIPGELNKTVARTVYNKKKLLDGTYSAHFEFGSAIPTNVKVKISDMRTTALDLNHLDISTQSGAESAYAKVDKALQKLDKSIGVVQNADKRLTDILSMRTKTITSLLGGESNLQSKSNAENMMDLIQEELLQGNGRLLTPSNIHKTNNRTVLDLVANALNI